MIDLREGPDEEIGVVLFHGSRPGTIGGYVEAVDEDQVEAGGCQSRLRAASSAWSSEGISAVVLERLHHHMGWLHHETYPVQQLAAILPKLPKLVPPALPAACGDCQHRDPRAVDDQGRAWCEENEDYREVDDSCGEFVLRAR